MSSYLNARHRGGSERPFYWKAADHIEGVGECQTLTGTAVKSVEGSS
jgi:hypothetical protein